MNRGASPGDPRPREPDRSHASPAAERSEPGGLPAEHQGAGKQLVEIDTSAMIADITETLSVDPRVAPGTGFGAGLGLRVDGRIFVIFMPDVLVLKLPASRVGELIAQTGATPFDAGKGKPMREWVRVSAERRAEWADLAQEALRFVSRG